MATPSFNDVVRHVILRIVVDQDTLGGELQKARQSLKGLEDAERESNKRRVKDSDTVTKAIERQTGSVSDNTAAHDLNRESAGRNADEIRESYAQGNSEIREGTKALREQNTEHGKNLREVRNAEQQLADLRQKLQRQNDNLDQVNADRTISRIRQIEGELSKLNRNIEVNVVQRGTSTVGGTDNGSMADNGNYAGGGGGGGSTPGAGASDADLSALRRRIGLLNNEKNLRQSIAAEARKGLAVENALTSAAERRIRQEDRWLATRRRGAGGLLQAANAVASDVGVLAARSVVSAPRSAYRAARGAVDRDTLPTLDTPLADMRRGATDTEKVFIRLFSSIRREGRDTEGNLSKLAGGLRKVFSGFRSRPSADAGGTGELATQISRVARTADGAKSGVASFFHIFRRDGDSATDTVKRLSAGMRAFGADLNRARFGGSGSGLFRNLIQDGKHALEALNGFGGVFRNMTRHMFSIQTLIIAVIAAFGPLAAILGAVGAAGLGLAANLVALAGSLAALPGLISAAISGFGALAVIIAPLSKVFSAFSAAQDAAAVSSDKTSRAARTSARALEDAQRRLEDANLRHKRAVEDLPRAYDRLHDARKQAKRDIEDYQFALRKLKYEEEGAALGTEQAEQDYRRALADPTANSLQRRQAAHGLEGAKFDEEQQGTDNKRLVEDAKEAIAKGVKGAAAVVDALRGVVDANRAITDSLRDQTRANEDLAEAQKDSDAGGTAARDAADKLKAELGKLGPETRKVVEALLLLSKAYKDMQKRISERFFGNLTGDTGKFADALKILESFIGPAAGALGELAHQAISLFTNPEWKKFFSDQGIENASIIKRLGEAALSAAEGFKNLIVLAQPLTDFIVDGIKGMADSFAEFTGSEKGRTAITDFLHVTMRTMRELKPVVTALFGGFSGFFKALTQVGGDKGNFLSWFNSGLLKGAQAFEEMGKKAQDPKGGFQKWLQAVKPLLADVMHFLGKVGEFFGDLFSNPDNIKEAQEILRTIADVWLPKLAEIFDRLSKSEMISKIAKGIGAVFDGILTFLDRGGLDALSTFASYVMHAGEVLGGLISTLTSIPGVMAAVGAAATLLGLAFVAKFSGLTKVIGIAMEAFRGLRNLMKSVGGDPFDDDKDTKRPNRAKKLVTNRWDALKDKLTGDDKGTAARNREANNRDKNLPGLGGPGGTDRPKTRPDLTGIGGVQSHLTRMERLLQEIRTCVCRMAGQSGRPGTRPGTRPTSTPGRRPVRTIPGIAGTDPEVYDPRTRQRQRRVSEQLREGGDYGAGRDLRTRPTTRPRPGSFLPTDGGQDEYLARRNADLLNQPPIRNPQPGPTSRAERNAIRERAGLPPLTSPAAYQRPVPSAANNRLGRDTDVIRDEYRNQRAEVDARRNERERVRDERNSADGRNQRLNDVAEAQDRRRRGLPGGTVPSFNRQGQTPDEEFLSRPDTSTGSPNNRRSRTTESAAQRRRRLAAERAARRNDQLTTPDPRNRPAPIDQDDEPAPVKQPKRKQSGYQGERKQGGRTPVVPPLGDPSFAIPPSGLDEDVNVPRKNQVSGNPKPPRDPDTGRITSPYSTNTGNLDAPTPDPAFPGGATPAPKKKPAQTRTPGGQFGPRPQPKDQFGDDLPTPPLPTSRTIPPRPPGNGPMDLFTDTDPNTGEKKSVWKPVKDTSNDPRSRIKLRDPAIPPKSTGFGSVLRNLFMNRPFMGDDSGSASVGSLVPFGPSGDDGNEPKKPSRWSRIKNAARNAVNRTRNDSGSVGVGSLVPVGPSGDTDDDDKPNRPRRDATTRPERPVRPSRRPSRTRPSGSRPRPGRPSSRPSSRGGVTYGDGYDDGYDDALGQGGLNADLPDGDDDDRRKTRKERREEKRRQRSQRRQDRRDSRGRGRGRGRGGVTRPGTGGTRPRPSTRRRVDLDDDDDAPRSRRGGVDEPERSPASRNRPSRGGAVRNLFGGAEDAVEGVARGGRVARLGGTLARGLAGGVGGIAAGLALSYGGDALINKFVRNDKDAGSLSRGVGAVANGAGIGATIGSVVPGIGTVVGGAVGGLVGGAYSLYKDKNLRNFVGSKVSGAAKAVGNFASGVGDKVSGFFGGMFGGDDDRKPSGPISGSGQIGGAKKDGMPGWLKGLAGGGIVGALMGGTDIGQAILGSLTKAGKGIGDFFTKTIPGFFERGIRGITDFFTKTLPSLPGRAIAGLGRMVGYISGFFTQSLPRLASKAWDFVASLPARLIRGFGRVVGFIVGFFTETLPRVAGEAWDAITHFFTDTLPNAAQAAWAGITGFFTETLPNAAQAVWDMITNFFTVTLPFAAGVALGMLTNFFTETLPNAAQAVWDSITGFFTETLPGAAQFAWDGITNFFTVTLPEKFNAIVDTMTNFFTVTLPGFFTETLPNAVSKLPGLLYDNIVGPVVEFFKGLWDHIDLTDLFSGASDLWNWAKGLFTGGYNEGKAAGSTVGMMSGGVVQGIYQGIQDTAAIMATPGEFMVRKSRVDEPGAKAFLRDFNDGRVTMADLYGGLSTTTAPQVMSIVPPAAAAQTGAVPTVVNNTVNHAPLMGNVTIHNPVREKAERSLRRQVEVAAIRHRR